MKENVKEKRILFTMKKSLFHDWYIFGRYNGKNFTEGFILNRKKRRKRIELTQKNSALLGE